MLVGNRVVEVLADHGADCSPRWKVASEYIIGGCLVLTAAHTVGDEASITVRLGGIAEHTAHLIAMDAQLDLALLRVEDLKPAALPVAFARIDRDRPGRIEDCRTIGFPRFKERSLTGHPSVRETAQIDGYIPTGEGLISGYLTLKMASAPRPLPAGRLAESEWEGMSGAAVFVGDYLVGIVVEHHLPEGGALTLAPIEWVDRLPGITHDLLAILGRVPDNPLPVLAPRVRDRGATVDTLGHRVAAHRLALPEDRADFIGRERELDNLLSELTIPSDVMPRVLAIIGQPGIGKTALAVHIAHRIAEAFPDGVLYIDLRGSHPQPLTPSDAARELLPALGVADDKIPEEAEQRISLCRDALRGRRVLVLFDNVRGLGQVDPLIPTDARPAFLLTSRSGLPALDGLILPLPVLSPLAATTLFRTIVRDSSRVQDKADLDEIGRLCGYLPLAVRISAALLKIRRHWTTGDLLRRLRSEQRLDVLKLGDLAVRAAFASSFSQLSEDQRVLFCLLGTLHAREFPAWTVSALLDVDDRRGERLIEELVDAQLVSVMGRSLSGEFRYTYHDLLRLFARERLDIVDPQTRHTAESRLLSGHIALGVAQGCRLGPGNEHELARSVPLVWHPSDDVRSAELAVEPMAWFLEQRPTLVAETGHAYEARLWPYVWSLADILDPIFVLSTHGEESLMVKELALAAAREAGDVSAEAGVRALFPGLLLNQGRWAEAVDVLTELLILYRRKNDNRKVAQTELSLAVIERDRGRLAAAGTFFARCIPRLHRLQDRLFLASARQNYAVVLREQGRLTESSDMLDSCLTVFEELGDRIALARALHTQAVLFRYIGELQAAERNFDRALDLCRQTGDRRWTGILTLSFARLCASRREWQRADAKLETCGAIFIDIQDDQGIAQVRRTSGIIARQLGDFRTASTLLREALDVFAKGDIRSEGRTRCSLALALQRQGDVAEAANQLRCAVSLLKTAGDEPWLCRAAILSAEIDQIERGTPGVSYEKHKALRAHLAEIEKRAGNGRIPVWTASYWLRIGGKPVTGPSDANFPHR
jgi:tetratricopeptide (TPR) repeat protein